MELKVSSDAVGKRLDTYLAEQLPKLSRSFLQKQCEQNTVHVNEQSQPSSYRLRDQDIIELLFDIDAIGTIPDITLPIIYEDDDCLVINKPVGILTHSKGAFNPEASVASFIAPKLAFEEPKDGENARAGIVHRLDRATSGLIICAKTPLAMTWLQKQFSSRKVKKTYYAIIGGTLEPNHAVIDMPIARNSKNPKAFMAHISGKSAMTEYEIEEYNGTHSLVRLKPTTGRTHQLRVHLSQLGHPIVGDPLYGGEKHQRMLLHAAQLEITLPNRQRHIFIAAMPPQFTAIMK